MFKILSWNPGVVTGTILGFVCMNILDTRIGSVGEFPSLLKIFGWEHPIFAKSERAKIVPVASSFETETSTDTTAPSTQGRPYKGALSIQLNRNS